MPKRTHSGKTRISSAIGSIPDCVQALNTPPPMQALHEGETAVTQRVKHVKAVSERQAGNLLAGDSAPVDEESTLPTPEPVKQTHHATPKISYYLKTVVENIQEAVIVTSTVLDEPGPYIEYVNPGFTAMTGYQADEVIGKSPRLLQGPSTCRSLLEAMKTALSHDNSFHGETVNYRKDGTEYLVEWLITPARGPNGQVQHWVSVQRDITDRRLLEASLAAKEERIGSIVESARDYAIFVTDRHDRVTDWWDGAAAVYGWSADQALGRQASMTFTAEDREAGVPEQEIAIASRDGIVPNVRWHLHADGYHVFIEGSVRALRGADGSLLGFLRVGQDVTARKAADKRLRDSEVRLTRALAAARMSTWEWDATSDTLQFSPGMETLYGRCEGSMPSVAATLDAIHPDDRTATRAAFCQASQGNTGGGLAVEFRVLLPTGDVRWLSVTGKAERNATGALTRLAGVTQDVTERRISEARIAHMARHDGLTGLANWDSLRKQLANALLLRKRGEACAVLTLDLDGFKDVNDVLGHAGGDTVLCSVAARLRRNVHLMDVVARPGGDEFVIVQSGLHQPSSAQDLATRLIAELEHPHEVDGQQVRTGVSIGIAIAPADGTEVERVLRCADLALYGAKQENANCYRFFEPEMQARAEKRRQMQSDLQQALLKGEFELHYQPLVELAGRTITGFEALVRWRHPVRGVLQPGEFMEVAEETGLIGALGSWVLSKACADAVQWPLPVRVAVNLSVRQLLSGCLPDIVAAALNDAGLEACRLELEITETLLLRDAEETLATLHQLRAWGVSISMDDFGTGYSSLSYLAKFPFDKVKIDRSFVAAAHEKHGTAIIRAVVDLCKTLDIVAMAEGIETLTQLQQVIRLGCTEGQGFLFARPCPAASVAHLLRHWNNPEPQSA